MMRKIRFMSKYRRIAGIAILGIGAAFFIPHAAYADDVAKTVAETVAKTPAVESQQQVSLPGWVQNGGHWYYLDTLSAPATGWKQIGGKYYYFRGDGAMATGSMKEGDTLYTFSPDNGNVAYARRGKNSGGGSFTVGFYDENRQTLADNLNELKEDAFDGDEDDDYYEDEKVDYDKDASYVINGKLTEIAEHRLSEARTKGYGNGEIPGEGNLDAYVKTIRYNSVRRFMEVYLKSCEDADDAEQKLLRSHDSDEKKPRDRAVYYKEIGIAHQKVDGKDYYMVIFMK